MGLGKTAVVLSALTHIIGDEPRTPSILIVAPKRVAEDTWPGELRKWDNFCSLSYSLIAGTASRRGLAARTPADLHIVSRDNLDWLLTTIELQYDVIVIDELSSFKNPSSKRFKALKKYLTLNPSTRVIGMTGTPVPNGLIDLWSQIYLLDRGQRLGKTMTAYKDNYFSMSLYGGFPQYDLRPGAERTITDKVSDICMSMSQKDYLELPPVNALQRLITPPEAISILYKELRREMALSIENEPITAVNAAALANKLLQFNGGSIYNEEGEDVHIHDLKLDALEDLIEEANGEPVLVYYTFKSEARRIKERFKYAVDIKDKGAIEKWNTGRLRLLMGHPASAGHGLNLQAGGRIMVWFNMTYDLELYQQANKRLHRMGQSKPVMIYHILTADGIDSHIYNNVLSGKAKLSDTVVNMLKV
jgi:SNF2 family DNA or RNA helicase